MLDTLMAVRGMKFVLLIDQNGSVVGSSGLEPAFLKRELGLIAAGKAVIGSLQSSLGSSEWTELLLDVEGGPALLTPFGPQILLTAFDDVISLGRVRFAIRRLIGP
ncbi:roadblock/LC7 domain-containing protein [Deinococcus sp.]|uniref:roadblock/LC7 domain-containing protein n=1 Tax=Deinococcus sp. TaxID=47478 RepID=UPI0028698411|nr:roadblock/LC7 domain-containing protein [Deinococcus sp.]